MTNEPPDELTVAAIRDRYGGRLDWLLASQVADSLDTLGQREQVLEAAIKPLRRGLRAFGPAATLQFSPVAADPGPDPYRAFIDYMDSIQPGAVAVLATSTPTRSGVWGELFSAAAMGAGVVGMVTDGSTRDSARILDLGFAAFSSGGRPIDYRGRQAITSTGEPVICGGVRVCQDDWVLADDDGVVVVPRHQLISCLDEATSRQAGETTVLDELKAGARLGEVWDRHGLL